MRSLFLALALLASPHVYAQEIVEFYGSSFPTISGGCVNGVCPQRVYQQAGPGPVVRATSAVVNGAGTIVHNSAVGAARVVGGVVHGAANVVHGTAHVIAGVVNRDQRAYNHALREAQIQARSGRVGHYLGVAPGARFSGVGSSLSASPNHCTPRGGMTLVARAVVRGNDGKYYWSAHYR